MKATISAKEHGTHDIETQARELIRRQMEEWFGLCDRVLDWHRSNFVFRKPSTKELDQHKAALKWIIRSCRLLSVGVSDPESGDHNLASRLQVRTQQLQDAYDTFHDTSLSNEQAARILRDVFPG